MAPVTDRLVLFNPQSVISSPPDSGLISDPSSFCHLSFVICHFQKKAPNRFPARGSICFPYFPFAAAFFAFAFFAFFAFFPFAAFRGDSMAAWAAAIRAIGTRNGLQLT